MCDRDGLWQDTSESEDGDEENNNVEDDETGEQINNRNENDLQLQISQDGDPEEAIFDIRRIVPQEVQDEVVAENEPNEARDGDVVIVGEDIAVEIVGETAVVADSTEEDSDDELANSEFQLPVINTATTAEVLGISSDDSDTTVEFEMTNEESFIHSSQGTSNQNAQESSNSQVDNPISVFYQTTGLTPHASATTTITTSANKLVSRGKRFPWRSFNNFGFSSDSDDEVEADNVQRENGEGSSSGSGNSRTEAILPVSSVTTAHSHTFYPFSGDILPTSRMPRIVSDPHETWSFSRATSSLPASRPNFDQRRFLREISRVEGDERVEHVATNQEEAGPSRQTRSEFEQLVQAHLAQGAGTTSQDQTYPSLASGRISPALEPSTLSRVIHNSGIVATTGASVQLPVSSTTRTEISPTCPHTRALRVTQASCSHAPRASNIARVPQTSSSVFSLQTSPIAARHVCHHRATRTVAVTCHSTTTQSQAQTTNSTPTTTTSAEALSQTDSRIRLARDFLRALSSPPIPSVPSLPNTTIRRILSVNTNELLGGDLTSPPNSPQTSMYGPLPLQPQAVRTPRFEPQPGTSVGPVNRDREPLQNITEPLQSFDRIDRILQLSRRTRVINDTIERSISRGLDGVRTGNPVVTAGRTSTATTSVTGTETSREDVRRQAQRILAEMQQQRREDARRLETGRRSIERAQAVLSQATAANFNTTPGRTADVSHEFVRDTVTEVASVTDSPVAKRARIEPSGQFEADIAEALKRSLADQTVEPQPGCSHWENDSEQRAPTPPQVDMEEVPNDNEVEGSVAKPVDNPEPDYEAMYRSLHTSHRKLVTELQSSLECPVCLDTIRTAPVQCCRNGHLICSLCITRTHICPTCRAPMTLQSGQRCVSHLANRLVDLLPHPCTNRDSGCEVEELLATLTQHEQDCPYRLVRCPIGYCMDNIPMASLSEHVSAFPHLLTTHAYPTSSNTNLLTFSRYIPSQDMGHQNSFQLRSFDPIRFTFSGAIFYLQTISSPDRRFLYNFIQLEGTKSDCSKYWASITVASFNPYTASQVCQTVRPTPLDLHCRDDLQSIGEAILMTEKVVVSILQFDTVMSRYQFKVKVKMMNSGEIGDQEQQE